MSKNIIKLLLIVLVSFIIIDAVPVYADQNNPSSGAALNSTDDNTVFNCSNKKVYKAVDVIARLFLIIRIIVPVIIVIASSVTFGKAVFNQDEPDTRALFYDLLKRIIIGVLIYFIPTIVISIAKYAIPDYQNSNNLVNCLELLR